MNFKTVLKSSVAVAALFAIAAPAANAEIKTGNNNSLTISGQVVRALWHADDGHSSETFISGGGASASNRLRWIASGTLSDNVTVGGTLEMATPISSTDSNMTLHGATVGTDGTTAGDTAAWAIKQEYLWVAHKTMGKLTMGHASGGADGIAAPSFGRSGDYGRESTTFGRGLKFISKTSAGVASLSSITVTAALAVTDGSGDDVIRYDLPTFGGVTAKIGIFNNGGWDAGLTYAAKYGALEVKATIGYDDNNASSKKSPYSVFGGVAALHDSGLSASIGGGKKVITAGNWSAAVPNSGDASYINWVLGYSAKLTNLGATQFSFSYTNLENEIATTAHNNSDATGMGVSVGQSIDAIGMNLNLSYRNYSFDSTTDAGVANTFDDISVISLQTVFAF